MAKINLQDGELARMQITKEQEVEISKLYRQTYLGLKKQMETLSHSGTTSESLQKTYLNKLVKQLKEAYKSNGEGLEKQIQKGMLDTAQAVVDNNSDWLKKAGLKVEGAYSYVPQDIVSLLSTGKLYGEGWSLSKAIWGDSQKKAHDIDQVVAAGVAANKSAYEIAKDLEKYVNPDAKKEWDWSKVYPGTSKKVDYNAQRLARTMVSHAYQQSLLATTKYNPFVTGYKWRSAHTHRTCELCNSRDGKTFSAEELPLDHPNGLCTFLVELDGSLEDVANRLGDWANGADDPALDRWMSSMGGPVTPSGELLTKNFERMSEDDYKKWQEQQSTYNQIYSQAALDLKREYGIELKDGWTIKGKDFYLDGQKMWASDYAEELLKSRLGDYLRATDQFENKYSYVQNADWSKNINQFFRTGDSSFLTDYFHKGRVTHKAAQQRAQEALSGIRRTAEALDNLIASTTLNKDMVVDRWGGVNSLSYLGITTDLPMGRIGHSFVTKGLDLESIKAQVDNLVGTVMVDRGYMSASASSELNIFQGSDIKFSINVKKGTHAFVTDNLSESEVIFGRGSKTEITGSRIIETEAVDTWSGEKVKTKSLEIFLNLLE